VDNVVNKGAGGEGTGGAVWIAQKMNSWFLNFDFKDLQATSALP
jgi:hypothetical protein